METIVGRWDFRAKPPVVTITTGGSLWGSNNFIGNEELVQMIKGESQRNGDVEFVIAIQDPDHLPMIKFINIINCMEWAAAKGLRPHGTLRLYVYAPPPVPIP